MLLVSSFKPNINIFASFACTIETLLHFYILLHQMYASLWLVVNHYLCRNTFESTLLKNTSEMHITVGNKTMSDHI